MNFFDISRRSWKYIDFQHQSCSIKDFEQFYTSILVGWRYFHSILMIELELLHSTKSKYFCRSTSGFHFKDWFGLFGLLKEQLKMHRFSTSVMLDRRVWSVLYVDQRRLDQISFIFMIIHESQLWGMVSSNFWLFHNPSMIF